MNSSSLSTALRNVLSALGQIQDGAAESHLVRAGEALISEMEISQQSLLKQVAGLSVEKAAAVNFTAAHDGGYVTCIQLGPKPGAPRLQHKIEAIKLWRFLTATGLKEAKEQVEAAEAGRWTEMARLLPLGSEHQSNDINKSLDECVEWLRLYFTVRLSSQHTVDLRNRQ